jgi:hypothetical protein
MKFNSCNNTWIDFSIAGVKENYSDKKVFFSEMISTHKGIEEKELKKILERVWKEVYPKREEKSEEKETV